MRGLFLEEYEPRITFLRPKVRPNMRVTLQEVAAAHDLETSDLLGLSRAWVVIRARQEFMWIAHRQHRYSLPHIGLLLHRDHSTVLHGVRAYERRRAPGYVPPQRGRPPGREAAA